MWLAGAALGGAGLWLLVALLRADRRVAPGEAENLCSLFAERRGWYRSAQRAAEEWGVTVAVQLAILYQESRLDSRARPPRRRLFRILPGPRRSSAYGYGQVVDATWDEYRARRDRDGARRDRFVDVVDFVGWYVDQIHRRTGVAKDDPFHIYLAYHEGPSAYRRGSHGAKPWLLAVAGEVESRARRYEEQHRACAEDLRRSSRWPFLLAALTALAIGLVLVWRRWQNML